MLILASTTDKLRVLTVGAGAIDVHASWLDNVSGAVQPGRTNTPQITTSTTTDVVGSPGAGVYRSIKTLHVHNSHATVANTVAVFHTDGSTQVELHRALLQAGDTLQYIDEVGFLVIPSVGEPAVNTRTLLKIYKPNGVPSFDIGPEALSSAYDTFDFDMVIHTPSGSADSSVEMLFSLDGGATYVTAAGQYHVAGSQSDSGNPAAAGVFYGTTNTAGHGFGVLNAIGSPFWQGRGVLRLWNDPIGGEATFMGTFWGFIATGASYHYYATYTGGLWGVGGNVNALRLLNQVGINFANGSIIKVYGVK